MAYKDLPTFYYHTHFIEFLDYVCGPCMHLLSQEHHQFLQAFRDLSHSQQCLLVRLINRKYPAIKRQSLNFDELPNVEVDLFELSQIEQNKHALFCRPYAPQDKEILLQVLTKAELFELASSLYPDDKQLPLKSANKAHFLSYCQHISELDIAGSQVANSYIIRTCDHFINYFLFLYFGHIKGQLNQFSMRDLGIMHTRDKQAQMQSRFSSAQSAQCCFVLATAHTRIRRTEFLNEAVIQKNVNELAESVCAQSDILRQNVRFLLAKAMLAFNVEKALLIAEHTDNSEAQEFWCRQAYKAGHKENVEIKLNAIIDKPMSDKLLSFAEDFLARKYYKKRTSKLTDMLRENSRHLCIDETFKGSVERGVIAYYESRGIQAWRTENRLWHNLFGLCFWPELFEIDGLGLATAFDYLPACLKHHQFIDVAEPHITARLNNINSAKDFMLLLTKHASNYYGQSQSIVNWHKNILDTLQVLVNNAPIDALKDQLLHMCENWQMYNDGYPDIMVLENNKLRFEEIKGEGDSLRRNQLLQIEGLRHFGIEVGVTTVDYKIDPMQAYVVVDIETTGGKVGKHRITEIGMVKMINGEIVDQWQSLINPQRRIPPMITNLTGINNDMVADAPLFSDIADELEAFTENSIFVAHNVNFDYGFFRTEFDNLERNFKRPKLCTVQQMRKHYKGLKSYSLANLTRHFNIDMQRHHRALSDALAASELLKLVNQARLEAQAE